MNYAFPASYKDICAPGAQCRSTVWGDSVTDNFLLKISATPPRPPKRTPAFESLRNKTDLRSDFVLPEGFVPYRNCTGFVFTSLPLVHILNPFESLGEKLTFSAPGGIRTPNDCFEGSYDIHFTTGAVFTILRHEPITYNTDNEICFTYPRADCF